MKDNLINKYTLFGERLSKIELLAEQFFLESYRDLLERYPLVDLQITDLSELSDEEILNYINCNEDELPLKRYVIDYRHSFKITESHSTIKEAFNSWAYANEELLKPDFYWDTFILIDKFIKENY